MEVIRPQQPTITQSPPQESTATPQVQQSELTTVKDVAPAAPAPDQPEQSKPAGEDLRSVVREISDFVQSQERKIQFQVSEVSGRTIIQVYDKVTEELIREIPSEEVQRISQAIRDELESGLLVKLEV